MAPALATLLVAVSTTGSVAQREGRPAAASIEAAGAVAGVDTPAAGAANAAAFARAFAASPDVTCQNGSTYFVDGTVRIPQSAHSLSGSCTIAAAAGFATGLALLEAHGNTGLGISGVEAVADLARFPGAVGFRFASQTGLVLDAVRATAGYGIVDEGSTGTRMTNPRVDDYNWVGIYTANETGISIEGADVRATKAAITVGHCIQIGGKSRYGRVKDGRVARCGYGFGVSIAGGGTALSTDMSVSGMHTIGTRAEGINFTNVTDFVATGNVETFDGDSTDFGLSVTSDNNFPGFSGRGLVLGNRIEGSCKAGIALALLIMILLFR